MSPEAQRIAIAEVCGWLDIQKASKRTLKVHPKGGTFIGTKDVPSINYPRDYLEIPNYLNDLNAMHKAEEILLNGRILPYGQYASNVYYENLNVAKFRFHATAAQRAEAFLRTLGKWVFDE